MFCIYLKKREKEFIYLLLYDEYVFVWMDLFYLRLDFLKKKKILN